MTKSSKDYMEKGTNCLSAKKYHKPKIVFFFSFLLTLFLLFVVFFENKSMKCYFIFFLFVHRCSSFFQTKISLKNFIIINTLYKYH